jgi:invasion protein IalB
MRFLLSFFLALLALTSAAAVAVLTGAISIAQPEPPVPKPNPAAPAAAPVAAPAAAQPQAPRPTVTKQEAYGDWIYTCLEVPQSKEIRCSIAQHLSDAKSKALIFLWRIAEDGKGGLIGIWQTPTGVLLSRGITLDAGTPKPIAIPFQTCNGGRCQAVANLAPDFLKMLAKSEKATATVFASNGKGVNLTISVKGLADGLAALRQ